MTLQRDQFRLLKVFLLMLRMAICIGGVVCQSASAAAQDGNGGNTVLWDTTLKTIRAKFPAVAQIPTDTLQSWLDKSPKQEDLILLDIREPEEFAVSHLPGARPAPSNDEALKAIRGTPANRRIVLYCSIGYRSSDVAEFLMKRGYTEVYNLEGSIFAWANEGRPVYRGSERVPVVHPYDEYWGRLLKKSLRAEVKDDSRAPRATSQ